MHSRKSAQTLLFALAALCFAGCSTVYYGALEKMGIPKRDLLVSRVAEARDAQSAAKDQFSDALSQFLQLTKVEPGEIKVVYDRLNDELKDCESRAKEVRSRIESVESVATALYREWAAEAATISDPADRRESERLLRDTQAKSDTLLRSMRAAADRMDPILTRFRDRVLLLKANLNAQAVAGLSGTAATLQSDINRLVQDMERAIRDAEAFLAGMKGT
jgi:hypothetical protein